MENLNETSEGTHEFKMLFITLLKGIYNTENAILDSLPKLIKAATTIELKDAFQDHEIVTQRQIIRLERIFRNLDISIKKEPCTVMDTFDKITQKIIKVTPDNSMVRDAGLIVIAQQIEHYEIATYGGLIQFALAIEAFEIADLLEQTLEEEEHTDYELTQIGECCINLEASNEDDHNEDEDEQENEDNLEKSVPKTTSSRTNKNSESASKDKDSKAKK